VLRQSISRNGHSSENTGILQLSGINGLAGPLSVAIGVDGYSPAREQQLRDVATVFVALTPLPQFFRGETSLLVQSELLELIVELGTNGGSEFNRLAPKRIPTFARWG
jgi:hypothetical protein